MQTSRLARTFQASILSLSATASLMAAVAEEAPFPGLLTIPVALAAYIFCERQGRLRLPPLVANALSAVPVAATLAEYLQGAVEMRVLAVVHLLIYLSWITMFFYRPPRHYWWQCGLGLIQVALSAAITGSGWFGLLLVVYLLLAVWTLSLFTLYLGELRYLGAPVQRVAGGSQVRNAIHFEVREGWPLARFTGNWLGLTSCGLLLGAALFMFVPRVWPEGTSTVRTGLEENITGFSEEVRLGEIGEILENSHRVLQVRIFDNDTNERLDMPTFLALTGQAEPLFRGMVLDTYFDGRWSGPPHLRLRHLPFRIGPKMIRQEYTLEPIGSRTLFAMRPIIAGKMRPPEDNPPPEAETPRRRSAVRRLLSNADSRALSSETTTTPGIQEYYVYSPRPAAGADPVEATEGDFPLLSPMELMRYVLVNREGLTQLFLLASEIPQPATLARFPGSPQRKVAAALMEHLRDSGKYTYSLKAQVLNSRIDPIEDFLFNRREGHCEYFSSALALMLRCNGIPSRVVTGFKGGRYNELSGSFDVQQRHAHSWVEAALDGRWVTLDPTPPSRQRSVEQFDRTPDTWQNVRTLSSSFWSNYVLRLDGNLQQEWFYDPLQKKIGSSLQSLRAQRGAAAGWGRRFLNFATSPADWLSWTGLQAGLILTTFIVLLVQLLRRWPTVWKKLLALCGREAERARPVVDFYEDFRRWADSCGWRRQPGQTQRDFIEQVKTECTRRGLPVAPELFTQLAHLFYQERFGSCRLSEESRRRLQDLIRELAVPGRSRKTAF